MCEPVSTVSSARLWREFGHVSCRKQDHSRSDMHVQLLAYECFESGEGAYHVEKGNKAEAILALHTPAPSSQPCISLSLAHSRISHQLLRSQVSSLRCRGPSRWDMRQNAHFRSAKPTQFQSEKEGNAMSKRKRSAVPHRRRRVVAMDYRRSQAVKTAPCSGSETVCDLHGV